MGVVEGRVSLYIALLSVALSAFVGPSMLWAQEPLTVHTTTHDLLLETKSPQVEQQLAALEKIQRHGIADPGLVRGLLPLFDETDYRLWEPLRQTLMRLQPRAVVVDTLLDALEAPDLTTRRQAAAALGRFVKESPDTPVLRSLIRRLGDSDKKVRDYASWALAEAGLEQAKIFIDALSDPDPLIRVGVYRVLGDLINRSDRGDPHRQTQISRRFEGLPVTPKDARINQILIKGLQDPDPCVRKAAAYALRAIGAQAQEATSALAELLGDASMEVRRSAAYALEGQVAQGLYSSVERIAIAYQDTDDEKLRRSLAAVLKKIGAQAGIRMANAVETLMVKLANRLASGTLQQRLDVMEVLAPLGPAGKVMQPAILNALHDPNPTMRHHAAWVLGTITTDTFRSIPALIEVLDADPHPKVREAAARALGQLGPIAQRAIPHLIATLQHPKVGVRRAAAWALLAIGPAGIEAKHLEALQQATADVDPQVRLFAVSAIGWLAERGRNADVVLLNALHDPDEHVRFCALGALYWTQGMTSDPRRLQVYAEALDDPAPLVRQAAAWILGEHGLQKLDGYNWSCHARDSENLKDLHEEPGSAWHGNASWSPDDRWSVFDWFRWLSPMWGVRSAYEMLNTGLGENSWQPLDSVGLRRLQALQAQVPALIHALNDDDAQVREISAWALGSLGPFAADAVLKLADILQQSVLHQNKQGPETRDSWPVEDIVEALGAIGVRAAVAVPALRLAIKPEYIRERRSVGLYALRALGQFGLRARDAVPDLIALLHEEQGTIAMEAAVTLANLGPAALPAVPTLRKLALSDDPDLAEVSRRTAQRIQESHHEPVVPTALQPLIQITQKAMAQNAFDEAAELLNLAIEFEPAFGLAYFWRGWLHLQEQDFEGAIADLDAAEKHGLSNQAFFETRAAAYFTSGRYADAEREYSRLIRWVPEEPMSYLYRAQARAAQTEKIDLQAIQADYDAAYSLLEQAAEAGQAQAQSMLAGMLLQGMGRTPDPTMAYRWYEKAAAGGNKEAALMAATICLYGACPEGVREGVRRLRLLHDAGDADAGVSLAFHYMETRAWPELQETATRLLDQRDELGANKHYIPLLLCYALHGQGKQTMAKELVTTTLDNVGNATEWPLPVLAYCGGNLSEEALIELSKKTDNAKRAQWRTETHFYVGLLHMIRGNSKKALDHYRVVLQIGLPEVTETRWAGLYYAQMAETKNDGISLQALPGRWTYHAIELVSGSRQQIGDLNLVVSANEEIGGTLYITNRTDQAQVKVSNFDGVRLSLQMTYQGTAGEFALVVPDCNTLAGYVSTNGVQHRFVIFQKVTEAMAH